MQIITDVLRAHLVPGLSNVETVPQLTFSGWLANERVASQAASRLLGFSP
jgi:hypothetical protein